MKKFFIKINSFFYYGFTMLIVVICVSIIMLLSVTKQTQNEYVENMDYEAETIANNLENLFINMDYITIFLMSNSEVLNSIDYISKGEEDTLRYNNSISVIQKNLYSYCIDKYFYRVNYFNENGTFITSNFRLDNVTDKERISQIINEKMMLNHTDRYFLLPEHEDYWAANKPEKVVSLIRRIEGENNGYFEVQVTSDYFEDLIALPTAYETRNLVLLNDQIIFSQIDDEAVKAKMLEQSPADELGREQEFIVIRNYQIHDGDNLKIYYEITYSDLFYSIIITYIVITVFVVFIIIFNVFYLQRYVKKLVVPVNYLKQQMDKTDIENLDEIHSVVDEKDTLAEIISLNNGYNRLIYRIKTGREKEKKLVELQMKTNLDALQAQVNPHFINNTLNVISYHGALAGDDDICEICNCISNMLKYSADTKKRVVTIREELNYVEAYAEVLKYRYQDKFRCSIKMDPLVLEQKIPKVVIQQLVENSINHGFKDTYTFIEIRIEGWIENDWWFLKVIDNGDGFDEKVLNQLLEEKQIIKNQIINDNRIAEMSIGGMGLMNVYSRMLLLHNEKFLFDIYNTDQGAAVVLGSVFE